MLAAQMVAIGSFAQAEGDAYIVQRGWAFVARIPESELAKKAMGSEFTDYYVGQRKPKTSLQLLSVKLPHPKVGSQLFVATYELDCANGAIKMSSGRSYDGRWNPTSEETPLKGTKWERPMPGSLTAFVLEAGCG